MINHPLYLASSSPRRQALLKQIGIPFTCLPNHVCEDSLPGEQPKAYTDRLALAKAQAGWHAAERTENWPVLGADSIVVIDHTILGKPVDKADAVRMMLMLSGKTHEVMTSIALVKGEHTATACSVSEVTFREITPAEAEAYWETGEPHDKAGGYGIQGNAAIFIRHMAGSYYGIMGLPIFELSQLLAIAQDWE